MNKKIFLLLALFTLFKAETSAYKTQATKNFLSKKNAFLALTAAGIGGGIYYGFKKYKEKLAKEKLAAEEKARVGALEKKKQAEALEKKKQEEALKKKLEAEALEKKKQEEEKEQKYLQALSQNPDFIKAIKFGAISKAEDALLDETIFYTNRLNLENNKDDRNILIKALKLVNEDKLKEIFAESINPGILIFALLDSIDKYSDETLNIILHHILSCDYSRYKSFTKYLSLIHYICDNFKGMQFDASKQNYIHNYLNIQNREENTENKENAHNELTKNIQRLKELFTQKIKNLMTKKESLSNDEMIFINSFFKKIIADNKALDGYKGSVEYFKGIIQQQEKNISLYFLNAIDYSNYILLKKLTLIDPLLNNLKIEDSKQLDEFKKNCNQNIDNKNYIEFTKFLEPYLKTYSTLVTLDSINLNQGLQELTKELKDVAPFNTVPLSLSKKLTELNFNLLEEIIISNIEILNQVIKKITIFEKNLNEKNINTLIPQSGLYQAFNKLKIFLRDHKAYTLNYKKEDLLKKNPFNYFEEITNILFKDLNNIKNILSDLNKAEIQADRGEGKLAEAIYKQAKEYLKTVKNQYQEIQNITLKNINFEDDELKQFKDFKKDISTFYTNLDNYSATLKQENRFLFIHIIDNLIIEKLKLDENFKYTEKNKDFLITLHQIAYKSGLYDLFKPFKDSILGLNAIINPKALTGIVNMKNLLEEIDKQNIQESEKHALKAYGTMLYLFKPKPFDKELIFNKELIFQDFIECCSLFSKISFQNITRTEGTLFNKDILYKFIKSIFPGKINSMT